MKLFISGTGTDVGKTFVTTHIIRALRAEGKNVQAVKPVVSGGASDAEALLESLGRAITPAAIRAIAPFQFAAPLAPPMAAAREGATLAYADVLAFARAQAGDAVLLEGAGGLFSPLAEHRTNADLAVDLGWPVLLVCGTYLGAIGHTLATLEAACARGVQVASVVVNASETAALSPAETAEALGVFAQTCPPVYTLSRNPHTADVRAWINRLLKN